MKKEQTTGPAAVENPLEPFPDYAAIRESKGIELKRLCISTKIRVSYLEAIEKGQFEKLPEAIYAETFIKTYARELGVDAGLILSHYRQFLKKTELPQETIGQTRPKAPDPVKRISNFKVPLKAAGWAISILVIVGFLVSFFATYMTSSKKPELVQSSSEIRPPNPVTASDQQKPTEQNAAATPAGAPAENEAATKEAAKPAAPARTSYKLMVAATETTWLNIVEDDSPPYEVLLRPGERIEREANEKFSIDVGNAGGVSVTFQGKALGVLGKSGQVVHLNLPDEAQD